MSNLLILTQPIKQLLTNICKVLRAVSSYAPKKLYIHLYDPNTQFPKFKGVVSTHKRHLISKIYSISPALCPNVDVRVLLDGIKFDTDFNVDTYLKNDRVFVDFVPDTSTKESLYSRYKHVLHSGQLVVLLNQSHFNEASSESTFEFKFADSSDHEIYEEVVLGGTFDRLHSGHKILLSEGVLHCSKRLTVGVSDGPLLKRKLLRELILPCKERINYVEQFLNDINPSLEYSVVPITDAIGPAGTDSRLQFLIVSEETKKGVDLINTYRKDKGLSVLDSWCIQIFEDCLRQNSNEESKFSSSSLRMRLLGSRIKDVEPNNTIPDEPYIIGLTGGIASGKSSIAKKLKDFGAVVIDCDKLGHKAYEYGKPCYQEIVHCFGDGILNANKEIDRKVLGTIVFNDKSRLKMLTDIVWPHIASFVKKEIEIQRGLRKKIVILDAAVLLEARWNEFCHEVWVCLIDFEEAVSRIQRRDGLSADAASDRIKSQMTNEERLTKAHIPFCSFWNKEYTHDQVKRAWNILESEGKF